ncbi:protein-ADP-ribose hydrolase [Kutzneria kofuensis]|uniref:O-acetyl-ADP-ribose deacetylase (Regulator of RNase III) n=1 Tax=Kutzneria kofuensis TaxID=103725 RepID=A0A7W9KBW6_9PSEU|nr:protein-ADP-ribose hydrolase [Kutzneria kofuensis]MBB5889783.1 O-acetyl-ADP-ribose deacetylase (regulator of RNase III) [Kutzneria kofuensis]
MLLRAYRDAVGLDEPFRPAAPAASPHRFAELTETALRLLGGDVSWLGASPREALRAALTFREPRPLSAELSAVLDSLLGGENRLRTVTDPYRLPLVGPGISLWRGDITTLAADAIVNAANSALLGCFRPMHSCVDNAIHAVAGPQLRADCHTIVTAQGAPEPTGTAKITRGYHLPARYVLHTVGPIVDDVALPVHDHALASCYRACLDLAAEVEPIRTIAFCGISTGVFGFPSIRAAGIALSTVSDWLDANPGRFDRVVFDTFGAHDHAAYQEHLTAWTR